MLYLGIAIVLLLLVKSRKGAALSSSDPWVAAQSSAIQTVLLTQDPGNSAQYDADFSNYEKADQGKYPGFYRSKKDGSWFNPDTGDFYSAASSPAATGPNAYETGAAIRPQINLDNLLGSASNNVDQPYNAGYFIP
jgi:hypothetical protein